MSKAYYPLSKDVVTREAEALAEAWCPPDNRLFPTTGAEAEEFDKFLVRYCEFQEHAVAHGSTPRLVADEKRTADNVPAVFHPLHCVNVRVFPGSRLGSGPQGAVARAKRLVGDDGLRAYGHVRQLYEDYAAKASLSKLRAMQQSRADLPIAQCQTQLIEALTRSQVVIIAGDTGCGKSTQVPQYLLQAGFNKIVCTQPRRISAVSLAKRVEFEMCGAAKHTVGFQVRFRSSRREPTRIVFVTEGILLRYFDDDPLISDFDVVIVDEIHERHVSTDVLLGLLRRLVTQRPKVKLVLMSATIDVERLHAYFGRAELLSVNGRMHPVTVHYMPVGLDKEYEGSGAQATPKADAASTSQLSEGQARAARRLAMESAGSLSRGKASGSASSGATGEPKPQLPLARRGPLEAGPYVNILKMIDHEVPAHERGDVLMFVSGVADISALCDKLAEYAGQGGKWIILPLHAMLSVADQDRVFDAPPPGVRKCIVSTDVAETSITIDGIRFVVDSGLTKDMYVDPETQSKSLQEFWICRASAEQRKGRAGRTGPGVCYRLYTQARFAAMDPFPIPELHRVPLDGIVLQLRALGCDPLSFQFIQPPPADHLTVAIRNLQSIGALDMASGDVTELGRVLTALPVEPVVGKMLVLGACWNMIDPMLVIAAAFSVASPFKFRHGMPTPDSAVLKYATAAGDPFMLLHMYDEWTRVKLEDEKHRRNAGSSYKWCKKQGVIEQRLVEMTLLISQFTDILAEVGLRSTRSARTLGSMGRHDDPRTTSSKSKKPRMLSLRDSWRDDADAVGSGDDKGDDEHDVDTARKHNRDFFTSADAAAIASAACRNLSKTDIGIIQLILASCLFPRVAVSDGNNHHRTPPEYVFHTPGLDPALLHPSSCLLALPESEGQLHELVVDKALVGYLHLLKTQKQYLIHPFCIPAAIGAFVCAKRIDTDAIGKLFLIDDFVQLEFNSVDEAHAVLMACCSLRLHMQARLHEQLGKSSKVSGFVAALPAWCLLSPDSTGVAAFAAAVAGLRSHIKGEGSHVSSEALRDSMRDLLHMRPSLHIRARLPVEVKALKSTTAGNEVQVTPFLYWNSIAALPAR